jgi:invasion protein IalB
MIRGLRMVLTMRILTCAFAALGVLAFTAAPAFAQTKGKKPTAAAKKTETTGTDSSKPDPKKPGTKASSKTSAKAAAGAAAGAAAAGTAAAAARPGKPALVASFGDWGAYTAVAGKSKTCYALAEPKERLPASLKRDKAYVFVSTRPGEGVKNEVSIIMGFDVKADSSPKSEVGTTGFDMIAQKDKLWVRNAAEEGHLLDAMRKGQRLIVKAASGRGNATTDSYSLAGLAQALDRVQKECQ